MNILFISPTGFSSPGLFEWMHFESFGHHIVTDPNIADIAFFDSHSGFAPYDWNVLDIVLARKIPVVYFDAFDYWGCENTQSSWIGFNNWKPLAEKIAQRQEWAMFLNRSLNAGTLKVYFMRKMQASQPYPGFVYPLEYCQFPDHMFQPVTKDQLFTRPHDVCFIGASSPWRANLVCSLLQDKRLKVDCFWPFVRIPHDEWLNRHRQAKLFIEADGGGFGSERPYQLITIAPMLRQRNDEKMANPWTGNVNCVEVGNIWGEVTNSEIENIISITRDPDRLYEIYINGIQHMNINYSKTARTTYILNVIKSNTIF